MKLYATELKPNSSSSLWKAFFPSLISEIFICIPDPLTPCNGLGMKVAYNPCLWAIDLTTYLNVAILSAVTNASAYLKSISFCPAATSWCEVSISNPISSKARVISLLAFSPKSIGPKSK